MKMLPMIWVNGKQVAPDEMAISPLDRGFARADGIFETMRAYSSNLFRLDDHLARLADGAGRMRINLPGNLRDQLDTAVNSATSAGHTEFALRLTVTRGISQGVALLPSNNAQPTVVIVISQLPEAPGRGLRIKIAEGRRNLHSVLIGVKSLSYTESIIELMNVQGEGVDDVIFFDTDENLSEATTSNVFIVKNGELITPSMDCAILAGITRKVVMEIAAANSILVTEREISREELEAADEIFLTSSVREIAAVAKLGDRTISDGQTGRLTGQIIEWFRKVLPK